MLATTFLTLLVLVTQFSQGFPQETHTLVTRRVLEISNPKSLTEARDEFEKLVKKSEKALTDISQLDE